MEAGTYLNPGDEIQAPHPPSITRRFVPFRRPHSFQAALRRKSPSWNQLVRRKSHHPLGLCTLPHGYLLPKYLQLPSPKPQASHNAQPVGGNEIAVLSIGIICKITVTFAKIDRVVRISLHSPHADSV